MPSSSSKPSKSSRSHSRSSSEASIIPPKLSKHRSSSSGHHRHHRRLSSSSSTTTASGSPPKSVVIILPAQRQPPLVIKTPSHRTAVPPPPALITRSVSAAPANPPRSRPILIPQQHKHHAHTSSDPNILQHHQLSGSPSSPTNSHFATHTPHYYYTITPISRSASTASGSPPHPAPGLSNWSSRATAGSTISEDDYYSHPAVREYELEKAAEQARWHQRVMQERESMRMGVPISASVDSASSWMQRQQRGW